MTLAYELGLSKQECEDAINLEKLYLVLNNHDRCANCNRGGVTHCDCTRYEFLCLNCSSGKANCKKIGEDRFKTFEIQKLERRYRNKKRSSNHSRKVSTPPIRTSYQNKSSRSRREVIPSSRRHRSPSAQSTPSESSSESEHESFTNISRSKSCSKIRSSSSMADVGRNQGRHCMENHIGAEGNMFENFGNFQGMESDRLGSYNMNSSIPGVAGMLGMSNMEGGDMRDLQKHSSFVQSYPNGIGRGGGVGTLGNLVVRPPGIGNVANLTPFFMQSQNFSSNGGLMEMKYRGAYGVGGAYGGIGGMGGGVGNIGGGVGNMGGPVGNIGGGVGNMGGPVGNMGGGVGNMGGRVGNMGGAVEGIGGAIGNMGGAIGGMGGGVGGMGGGVGGIGGRVGNMCGGVGGMGGGVGGIGGGVGNMGGGVGNIGGGVGGMGGAVGGINDGGGVKPPAFAMSTASVPQSNFWGGMPARTASIGSMSPIHQQQQPHNLMQQNCMVSRNPFASSLGINSVNSSFRSERSSNPFMSLRWPEMAGGGGGGLVVGGGMNTMQNMRSLNNGFFGGGVGGGGIYTGEADHMCGSNIGGFRDGVQIGSSANSTSYMSNNNGPPRFIGGVEEMQRAMSMGRTNPFNSTLW